MKTIMIGLNGVAEVFDESGNQQAEYQNKGWLSAYLDYLLETGLNTEECIIEFPLPGKDNNIYYYAPFLTNTGDWNACQGYDREYVVQQRKDIKEMQKANTPKI